MSSSTSSPSGAFRSSPPPPPSADPDAEARALVTVIALPDAACPHCRYSLAGLNQTDAPLARCPECGGGLRPGLVGSGAPKTLRRVVVLLLVWVAFAGAMNATRQWLMLWDYYINVPSTARFARFPGAAASQPAAGWGGIPMPEWIALGWWAGLGLIGTIGAITAGVASHTARVQRRLLSLAILCFLLYWGYHAVMFAYEVMERL